MSLIVVSITMSLDRWDLVCYMLSVRTIGGAII